MLDKALRQTEMMKARKELENGFIEVMKQYEEDQKRLSENRPEDIIEITRNSYQDELGAKSEAIEDKIIYIDSDDFKVYADDIELIVRRLIFNLEGDNYKTVSREMMDTCKKEGLNLNQFAVEHIVGECMSKAGKPNCKMLVSVFYANYEALERKVGKKVHRPDDKDIMSDYEIRVY